MPATTQAEQLQAAAEATAAQASRDIHHANDYVLAVVPFSAALFFGGISTRLRRPRPRAVVLGVGCAVLVVVGAWGRWEGIQQAVQEGRVRAAGGDRLMQRKPMWPVEVSTASPWRAAGR